MENFVFSFASTLHQLAAYIRLASIGNELERLSTGASLAMLLKGHSIAEVRMSAIHSKELGPLSSIAKLQTSNNLANLLFQLECP